MVHAILPMHAVHGLSPASWIHCSLVTTENFWLCLRSKAMIGKSYAKSGTRIHHCREIKCDIRKLFKCHLRRDDIFFIIGTELKTQSLLLLVRLKNLIV